MRAYFASLSDYNAGHLHGTWIDLEGKDDADVNAEIAEMLRGSKYPNVTVECPNWSCKSGHVPLSSGLVAICPDCNGSGKVPSAEEWAVHDYDELPSSFGEYPDLAELLEYVEKVEEHGDAWVAYLEHVGANDATEDDFENCQAGEAVSEEAWIEEHLDNCGTLEAIPENLRSYFDTEAYLRDMKANGEVAFEEVNGTVYAFWNH